MAPLGDLRALLVIRTMASHVGIEDLVSHIAIDMTLVIFISSPPFWAVQRNSIFSHRVKVALGLPYIFGTCARLRNYRRLPLNFARHVALHANSFRLLSFLDPQVEEE